MLAAAKDGPRALRNRALLAVTYDSLCRGPSWWRCDAMTCRLDRTETRH